MGRDHRQILPNLSIGEEHDQRERRRRRDCRSISISIGAAVVSGALGLRRIRRMLVTSRRVMNRWMENLNRRQFTLRERLQTRKGRGSREQQDRGDNA
jgi:hypothetical protein